jgi:hypothetical protein
VKEENGYFEENRKMIEHLVAKKIRINYDYNRKTQKIENKYKDY